MVLSDYILRFLKFGDFERGEVRVRIEKAERDWEKKEGGIERVEEGGREGGEGEGGDEKERHGHMRGRELGQRLKVAIARGGGSIEPSSFDHIIIVHVRFGLKLKDPLRHRS
ncbi:hypothetical protein LR48_Vigan1020s000800 [Vigna angularis]|uniref:Uncharacterized protein n=1 Tax=Phaseolus angularis TaxID=3914 RepID=A0A0L9THV3_PHAAN|nr:hypothetical protein LR48_Vigan1020s000800 [Vigna angularis]